MWDFHINNLLGDFLFAGKPLGRFSFCGETSWEINQSKQTDSGGAMCKFPRQLLFFEWDSNPDLAGAVRLGSRCQRCSCARARILALQARRGYVNVIIIVPRTYVLDVSSEIMLDPRPCMDYIATLVLCAF
jgi:hypothetical protein